VTSSTAEIRLEEAADHARVWEIQRAAFGDRLQADLVEALRARAEPQLSLVASLEEEPRFHEAFAELGAD